MRDNKYEERTITRTERVLVRSELLCGMCRKKIGRCNGYWKAHAWHDDWGNDSIESHEHFDVCSTECLIKKFEEYCTDSSQSDYNTWQIEVEHTMYT